VILFLLANICLHEVVDLWFATDVQPRRKGPSFLVRYADDLVMGIFNEDDARRVMDVLPKCFERYRLSLHPDKTRLVRLIRPPQKGKGDDDGPDHVDFLGFRHYWGKSRRGFRVVKRKTVDPSHL
jgi:RNA-directed DNA polymerase